MDDKTTYRIAEFLVYNADILNAQLDQESIIYDYDRANTNNILSRLAFFIIDSNPDIIDKFVWDSFDDERIRIIFDMYYFKEIDKNGTH